MKKLHNVVFPVAFLLFLSAVVIFKCLGLAGIDVVSKDSRSVLEGREYQSFPSVSISALASGEFQDEFEQYVADLVPYRDEVLLSNAAAQRVPIMVSAVVAGYSVYPTFYGSDRVYDAEHDLVSPKIYKQSEELASQYGDAADCINAFADRYPNSNVVFCDIDRLEYSDANPTSCLISSAADHAYVADRFLSHLSGDVTTVAMRTSTTDDYVGRYYRSDHHWKTSYAYQGYAAAMGALKPYDDPVVVSGLVDWDGIPFYGSNTRTGLFELADADTVEDVLYERSDGLTVTIDGKRSSIAALNHYEKYRDGSIGEDRFTNRYAEYYHGDYGLIEISNPNLAEDDKLIVVEDSLSNCIDPLFAEHYGTVAYVDPRHYDGTIDDLMDQYPEADVLFFMGGTNYTTETFSAFVS